MTQRTEAVDAAHRARPRIWVTGGRGMLGQAVCAALADVGCAAIVSGRELDIADEAALCAFATQMEPTHLINCAAMTAVDRCESEIDVAQRTNAQGPLALGRLAARFSLRAAHVSTDYVFDTPSNQPLREDAPCAPRSVYGKSKLAGEKGFLGAGADGALVVRTSWLFGPHGNNFVSTMLALMANKSQLQVVDDQRGRPTSSVDLAAALLALLGLDGQTKPAPGGIYHFANDGAVSWYEFAREIHRQARQQSRALMCERVVPTTSAAYVRPAPRPAYSVLDTRKTALALGYAPRPYTLALQEYMGSGAV